MKTSDKALYILLGLFAGGLLIGGIIYLRSLSLNAAVSTGNFVVKNYTNLEEWTIIRDDKTGRTQGIRVKRSAEET